MLQVAAATVVVAAVTSAVLAALDWTGGPQGFRRWEYSTSRFPHETDPVWRDVPADAGLGRRLRVSGLETYPPSGVRHYEFKIRERGDERDPAETNPAAVARVDPAWVHPSEGHTVYWGWPLEPRARFWLETYGVAVTAPPEGEFVVWPWHSCTQVAEFSLTLRADDDEVQATAHLLIVLKDSVSEGYSAHELRWDGLTAREMAEHAATPGLRAAYRLLVQVIESMFGDYPRIASAQLEEQVADSC